MPERSIEQGGVKRVLFMIGCYVVAAFLRELHGEHCVAILDLLVAATMGALLALWWLL